MVPARTQLQQANPWGETEFTSEPDDLQTTASYDWGQTTNNEGDFFSSMLTNKVMYCYVTLFPPSYLT